MNMETGVKTEMIIRIIEEKGNNTVTKTKMNTKNKNRNTKITNSNEDSGCRIAPPPLISVKYWKHNRRKRKRNRRIKKSKKNKVKTVMKTEMIIRM